jgi:hypothetical protein
MRPPEPTLLTPTETVTGRPFTDPTHLQTDFAVLEQIRATLLDSVRSMPVEMPPGTTLYLERPERRTHRIIVLDHRALLGGTPLAVVGFFGQRRPGADPSMLQELDAELIDELRSHPAMLSYSSVELPCGAWANLVVLADAQGARRWRESARHVFAASQVAPSYYSTVRIHNAALPSGLESSALVHIRTLYYDFAEGGWWQGVRAAEAG